MKFKINTKIAANAVSNARSIIASRNIIPILSDLYWVYAAQNFYITGFDGDNAVTLAVPIMEKAENPCDFCINAVTLDNALRSLRDDDVIFEVDEKSLTIRHKKGKLIFPLDKCSEYPEILTPKGEGDTITIPTEKLLEIAEKGHLFAGNEELRPIMNAILLERSGNTLYAVASDSRKLIKMECDMISAATDKFTTMLPREVIPLIPKLFGNMSKNSQIIIKTDGMRTHICNDSGSAYMVYKNLEGHYPNWRSIMPNMADIANKIEVNREDMADSLQRLCMINKDTQLVKLLIDNDKQLKMESENLDSQSSGDESISVGFSGLTNSRIGMKATNLIDGLMAYDTEKIIICTRDETKSCMILPTDKDDKTEVIIMPMKLNS